MHENTKRLRALMREERLKAVDVADITGRKTSTVRVWRCRSGTRVIPAELLRLVELTAQARNSGGVKV